MEPINLTSAEWHIMECLWETAPQTGRELAEKMEARMGFCGAWWTRASCFATRREQKMPFPPLYGGRMRPGRKRRTFWTGFIRGV